jgi:2-hydroxychromene-2-carboxylate isomerase
MSYGFWMAYDIEFHWDPVCPFAWITSRWINKVVAQKDYSVDWRFISLRILNKDKDYAKDFPEGYEYGHTAGLRMLRVAAAMRADGRQDQLGSLYTGFGESIFDVAPEEQGGPSRSRIGTDEQIEAVLTSLGMDTAYVDAANDTSWDADIEADTEHALSHTGRDVGTPIITFKPPNGLSFFGPVISRVPTDEEAVPLWDSVITLATFPGFAELKRSLREVPQLAIFGQVDPTHQEDWKGGHRADAK